MKVQLGKRWVLGLGHCPLGSKIKTATKKVKKYILNFLGAAFELSLNVGLAVVVCRSRLAGWVDDEF